MSICLCNISEALIWTDRLCDRLPLISTPVNLINIFIKCALNCYSKESITENRYFSHIQDKRLLRCITLLVPIIGNVIVGIYDLIQYYSKKSAIDLKANHLELDAIQKNSLDKIGGFSQAGNTCYIASTLQALRQVPYFRTIVSSENKLIKKQTESDEAFESRMKVKQAIYNLMVATDKGETISKKTFREFHEILYSSAKHLKTPFSSPVSPPGKGGDQKLLFYFIMNTLEITAPDLCYSKPYDDDTLINMMEKVCYRYLNEGPKIIQIERLSASSVGEASEQHVSRQLSKNLPMEFDWWLSEEEKCTYKLVAATAGTQRHTWAYLRDISNPESWVCCNDGRVNKVRQIPQNETVHYLYYARMD